MNRFFIMLLAVAAVFGGASCHKNDDPSMREAKRTLLIYAVASNNLSSYLDKDIEEMIDAAPSVSGLSKDVRVLMYSVASKSADEATVAELSRSANGRWDFKTLKTYDRDTFSTDPARISEVISDLRILAPAENYGLIFWSHATGWFPDFNTHVVDDNAPKRSFGWDSYGNLIDKCDIDELADAIPDRMFDYIWFDSCYMMGIESVFQLRRKCDYIGGYPTEDWNWGMNYDKTLPMLAAQNPDLKGVAKAFFDYYNDMNMAVTVSLIATEPLERLAAAAADIYSTGICPDSAFGMQDYGRSPYRGLYDFGQFTRAYLEPVNGDVSTLATAFDKALSEVLLFGGCSSQDFHGNHNAFNPEIFSGFSCHFPGTSTDENEEYWRSLDWVKATNP